MGPIDPTLRELRKTIFNMNEVVRSNFKPVAWNKAVNRLRIGCLSVQKDEVKSVKLFIPHSL